MGVEPLRAGVRVEVQLPATARPPLRDEPVEQRPGMALAPSIGGGREIVDVQVAPPRKAVPDAKPGNRRGLLRTGSKRGNEPVAGRPQDGVDVLDKLPLVRVSGPQRTHRPMRETGLARRQLANRGCRGIVDVRHTEKRKRRRSGWAGKCRVGLLEGRCGGLSGTFPIARARLRGDTAGMHETIPDRTIDSEVTDVHP